MSELRMFAWLKIPEPAITHDLHRHLLVTRKIGSGVRGVWGFVFNDNCLRKTSLKLNGWQGGLGWGLGGKESIGFTSIQFCADVISFPFRFHYVFIFCLGFTVHFDFVLPLWFHFDSSSCSLRFPLDHISISIRFNFDVTSVSFRIHFGLTEISPRFYIGFLPISFRSHFGFNSFSHRYHFGSTSISFRTHFYFALASLRSHFDLTLV